MTVDPAKDLPRYPPVEVSAALATWKIKAGFKLELAASEPQIRDPIAVSFDENGRMFVCEMVDYSEMRDATPHVGRISVLEDKDSDGVYESHRVFADDLPWPSGVIWANGGLFVCATPDIWRFEDRDGDGRAEIREKVFTGFGSGLDVLNVQALMNSPQWGQDNLIHIQTGGGNRGKVQSAKRPDLPAEEIGGRDFWFDPRTYAFGFEGGGAQYGMSFDNYGRKFGSSNSNHLQHWVYDDRYVKNKCFSPAPARLSIAADGAAAEVFRISPDEPWRIIRTRWRVGGVVPGAVEGGGRVSGYFTGATGTTVYRGDALGTDFINNTFTGDAGGQLVHRKVLHPNGVSLIGRRPPDEQGVEFAASTDTWVRVVGFANAPDGCLYICDMYREVIEHPWSLPEELKVHLDLNSGNDRGRVYRIAPTRPDWQRRSSPRLGKATTAELVKTLAHANGWHRDTAHRLLYERQDPAAIPLLRALLSDTSSALARHHALGVLDGLGGFDEVSILVALADGDEHVRTRAVQLTGKVIAARGLKVGVAEKLSLLAADPSVRVRYQLAFTLPAVLETLWPIAPGNSTTTLLADAYARLAKNECTDPSLAAALLSGRADVVGGVLFPALMSEPSMTKRAPSFLGHLIETHAASTGRAGYKAIIDFIVEADDGSVWLGALGRGLRHAGVTIEEIDPDRRLARVLEQTLAAARNRSAPVGSRVRAVEALGAVSTISQRAEMEKFLAAGEADGVQTAAIASLLRDHAASVTAVLLGHWRNYGPKAKDAALTALLAREDRSLALLDALQAGAMLASDLLPAQRQRLIRHRNPEVSARAKAAFASASAPNREKERAKFKPALDLAGDAARGRTQFQGRCSTCHRAGTEGTVVGPDLTTVRTKGRETLLTAILEPHQEVAPQYIAYDVTTTEGDAYTGIIVQDDANILTLQVMGGHRVSLPRVKIKTTHSSGRSLMPDGLQAGMSVADMADLLAFIESIP